jgi:hypothetical protein
MEPAVNIPEVPASWRPLPCPFCLMPLTYGGSACDECNQRPPRRYFDALPPPQPLPLQLLGTTRQGKSSYLQALLYMLPRLTRLWPGFAFSPATDDTRERLTQAIAAAGQGRPPGPTVHGKRQPAVEPVDQATPEAEEAPAAAGESSQPQVGRAREVRLSPRDYLILLTYGLPLLWGTTRTFVLHDLPGEDFGKLQLKARRMPLVHRSPRCLMFFRLPEIEAADGDAMALLLSAYVETLLECGVQVRDQSRQVIVVLTHAESATTLPPPLRRYLQRDPLWAATVTGAAERGRIEFGEAALTQYLEGLHAADAQAKLWLTATDAGSNFLRLAAAWGVSTRVCLVSATGAAALHEAQFVGWQPHRILDPLFWALELDREARSRAGEQPS